MTRECPLCLSMKTTLYHQDKKRCYFQCKVCDLIYVPSEFHLSNSEEKAIYDQHENQVNDPCYREFLNRLVSPLQAKLNTQSRGLDFGCGPGPALVEMFIEAGFSIDQFDIYYFPDKTWEANRYSFITATEVIEHIARPNGILKQLISHLTKKGWLAIMTKRATNKEAFVDWHYKNDPTHICFYSEKTFRWIGNHFNLELQFEGDDIVFMQKKE